MVQLVPAGSAWWLRWSLPDSGFGLQTSINVVSSNSWATLTGPDAGGATLQNYTASGSRFSLLPASALGSPTADYFRLLQQAFVKLQVLMPGETAAPGTASGKTGSPTPQQVGVPFDVTVNAVDNHWFVISATDMIHITSSDGAATLPPDAALIGGTGTFSVTLNTAGSKTVTASDVTDATKVANTGTSTSVNP